MTTRRVGGEGAGHTPTARFEAVSTRNRQEAGAHAHDGTTNGQICPVPASFLARLLVSFAGLSALLLTIAAVGLAVEALAGVGGLWLLAGIFVVVLMAAMRKEGAL